MLKLISIVLAATALAMAQQAPVQSPEIQPDGKISFHLRAPGAHAVIVHIDGMKDTFPAANDGTGVWTATTGPLPPDLYGYSFEVDGVRQIDPSNVHVIPNLLRIGSVAHVPGPTPLPWEDQNIPHGVIHHHFYHSNAVGDDRDFYVYTPPGYDAAAKTSYPVLYLLHGFSDDASAWTAVGKANFILDSLIDSGKAKPMIVVMTLGYGAPEIVQSRPGTLSPEATAALHHKNVDLYQQALFNEVIPAVQSGYRAATDRDQRAITGLSMGGAESLLTGLNHLDKFGWVGSFSAGGTGKDLPAAFPNLTAGAAKNLHLLWVACGTDDRLITPNRGFVAWVKGKGIPVTAIETPGMHAWQVWRRNLIAFAPLLFPPSQP